MIKKERKKAVSDVVATVLIILLTVSAVSLLIAFIKPFVQKNLDSSTACLPYQTYYQFEETINDKIYNCYQKTQGEVLIGTTIKFGNELSQEENERLSGFILVFSNENLVETANLTDGRVSTKKVGDIWELGSNSNVLKVKENNDIRTFVYKTTTIFSDAKIYPILKSGRICEVIDSVTIKQCSEVNLE